MALFTGKGDCGTTNTFGCNQKVSKSSNIAEALGTLDEINSFLGICKEKSRLGLVGSEQEAPVAFSVPPANLPVHELIHQVQQNLFIVQAELAGADKYISHEKVVALETIINEIERAMPPITTFFISGGTELAAHLDYARTLARRAERRVVAAQEDTITKDGSRSEGLKPINENTRAYMNRLSSLLYALARLTNHLSGIKEEPPKYE